MQHSARLAHAPTGPLQPGARGSHFALAMLAPSLCWLLGAVVATVVWLWEPPLPLSVEDWQGAALPQKAVPASARDLVTELQV